MHSPRRLAALLPVSLCLAFAPSCTPSSGNARQTVLVHDSASPAGTGGEPGSPSEMASEPVPDPPPPQEPLAVEPPPARVARPIQLPPPVGAYRVRLVDESHRTLPTYAHAGRTYVMGTIGSRYSIVVTNPTGQRVEAVVSVDGLDAMDGKPADYVSKRGYVLAPYGEFTFDGFRTSMDEVATFRFSSVSDSYAGRLGEARDVGVIGVAFFTERAEEYTPPPAPYASQPARRYAPAPKMPAPEPSPSPPPATRAATTPALGGASGGSAAPQDLETRRGLGTEFGEARESRISSTSFERANGSRPSSVVSIRYNDRAGLTALGIVIPPPAYANVDVQLRETADPFRTNQFSQPPPPR